MAYQVTHAVSILAATATGQSAVYDFGGGQTRMGLIMPHAWTAATITFLGSNTAGGTFAPIYNEAGNEVELTVAIDKAYSINTSVAYLAPFRWIKVRSGNAGLPVQQDADRVLYFMIQR